MMLAWYFRDLPPMLRWIHRLVGTGIAIAMATLLLTFAIMQGFWQSYTDSARGFYADVVLQADPEQVISPEVRSVIQSATQSPFLYREGLLGAQGVVLKGVDLASYRAAHPGVRITGEFPVDSEGPLPVIMGSAISRTVDSIFVATPAHPKGRLVPTQVVGTFSTGLYDFDHQFILVPLDRLAKLFGVPESVVSGVELRLKDPTRSIETASQWQEALPTLTVTHWGELNRNMFDALRLQRTVFMVLMSLFVLIALANLSSVIGLQVYFRRKDSAIFRVLGMSRARLRFLFWQMGMVLAVAGIAGGAGIAALLIWGVKGWVRLPESIYFVQTLPLQLSGVQAVLTIGAAILLAGIVVAVAVQRLLKIPLIRGLQ